MRSRRRLHASTAAPPFRSAALEAAVAEVLLFFSVDVGITRTDAGLVGDVAPEVRAVAGFLAPVPGGTGPMTRAMLLLNVVESAEHALAARRP